MGHHTLDVRNQLCPIPVIRTQNTMRRLEAGDTLEVVCTDPGALHDIPAWARINGHEIVMTGQNGREIQIVLKVCGAEETCAQH